MKNIKTISSAFVVFVFSLTLGLYGSQGFINQNQLAAPAASTATSLFDDYDSPLTYVDQSSFSNVTWDNSSAINFTATAPTTGGEIDPATPLGQGLVGLWHLNDGNLTSAVGSYTGTNVGSVTCNTSITGKFGSGCEYADSTSHTSVGDVAGLESGLSFSFWVKSNVASGTTNPLFQKTGAGNDSILCRWLANNSFSCILYEGTTTHTVSVTSQVLTDMQWHHIALTFNGQEIKIYYDGVLKQTTPFVGSINDTTHPLTFGKLNGKLDEVAVWNRALSPTEVSQLASAGGTPPAGSTSGSFQSTTLNTGKLASLTATWAETMSGASALTFSTDNGSTWCPIAKGQNLTSSACFNGTTLKYKTTFSATDSFQSINLSWVIATTQPPNTCGNGTLDTGETCDGVNLNNQTCVTQGFASGTLACNNTCTGFNTSQCVAVSGGAKTIYVDNTLTTNCTGNYSVANRSCGGTNGDAYNTIQKAANVVGAGDVVEIRGGTYRSFGTQGSRVLIIQDKSGTQASPITFRNYNGEKVSLVGTGTSWQVMLLEKTSYINISGLDISAGGNGLVVSNSHHINLDHLIVHNISGTGMIISQYSLPSADFNSTHDITVSYSEFFNCGYVGLQVGPRDGEYEVYNVLVEDSLAYDSGWLDADSGGNGFEVLGGTRTYNNTFRRVIGYGNTSDQAVLQDTRESIIEDSILFLADRNSIVDSGGKRGDGRGGKFGTAMYPGNNGHHKFRGNIVFSNNRLGFGFDSVVTNNSIHNNIIYDNGFGKWGSMITGEGTYIGDQSGLSTFYNNIVYGNFKDNQGVLGATHNYNLWGDFFGALSANEIEGQNPLFNNPDAPVTIDFPSGTPIETKLATIRGEVRNKFSLQAGSPAIDKGVKIDGYHCSASGVDDGNGCRVWYGNAPDIGAYEYNPGGQPPTQTCGNNVREGTEQCDGSVGANTCQTRGFTGGTLTCTNTCTFNTSQCTTTTPDTTAPVITNVLVSNLTATSATLTWLTNEPATTQVDYGFIPSYGQSSPFVATLTTTHTVTLANLSAGTTYHYRVRSQDAAGNLAPLLDYTFTTLTAVIPDTTPPQATTDLRSSAIAARSATLTFTAPYQDSTNPNSGPVKSYDLRYTSMSPTGTVWPWSTATPATGLPTPTTPGQPETYILVGLTPNQLYSVAMKSQDSAGNLSALSNVISLTTTAESAPNTGPAASNNPGGGPSGGTTPDLTPPAAPTQATIAGANRQAILNWQNPTDPDFVRTLVLRSATLLPPTTNPRLLTQAKLVYDGTVPSFTDTNLVNGQLYRYTLYAYDRSSNYAPPVTLTVKPLLVGSTVSPTQTIGPSTNPALSASQRSLLLQLYRELLKLLQQLLALLVKAGR